jgi:hypothetical protein
MPGTVTIAVGIRGCFFRNQLNQFQQRVRLIC